MKSIKSIIVDDEEFARSSLFFLLQQNCPEVEIVGIAKSVVEAKILLAQNQIDLIFLDIAMPGGSGFELISTAAEQKSAVIFTTAYAEHAIKAIKANALDYLLKPIDIDELMEAVEKAKTLQSQPQQQKNEDHRMLSLADTLDRGTEITKITLPLAQGFKVVSVEEILYIEADSNYSIFHLSSGEKITVSKVLKEFEEILPTTHFLRVHKSTLINLNYLAEYNNKNGLQIFLTNGESLNVSRRRATAFFDKIKAFTKSKTNN